MNTNNTALSYLLQKIQYRFVKNLVEKNYSLEDILEELKSVGLETKKVKENTIKNYIEIHLGMEWDEKENVWKEALQGNLLAQGYEEDHDIPWNDLIPTLSEDDAKTLLKDMKYILSNVKKVVKDVEKITGDINTIVAAIKPKYTD